MEMLQGVWKQHLRPRAVVGYGVKIFLPSIQITSPDHLEVIAGSSLSSLFSGWSHLNPEVQTTDAGTEMNN